MWARTCPTSCASTRSTSPRSTRRRKCCRIAPKACRRPSSSCTKWFRRRPCRLPPKRKRKSKTEFHFIFSATGKSAKVSVFRGKSPFDINRSSASPAKIFRNHISFGVSLLTGVIKPEAAIAISVFIIEWQTMVGPGREREKMGNATRRRRVYQMLIKKFMCSSLVQQTLTRLEFTAHSLRAFCFVFAQTCPWNTFMRARGEPKTNWIALSVSGGEEKHATKRTHEKRELELASEKLLPRHTEKSVCRPRGRKYLSLANHF